jgi:hypothetical protein
MKNTDSLDLKNLPIFSKEPPLPPISGSASATPNNLLKTPGDDDGNSNGFTKLSNVEAQRIMSVINEIQRKTVLVGLLPDHMDRRSSGVFSGDLLVLLTVC